MHSEVTFLAALVAGLVSFLSPCVLPLVPPYLVFLAGTSLERFAEKEAEPRVRRETVIAAALFVLGFSTVFVALGASASVVGALVRAYSGPLATVAGIIIIIMGLHFLGVTPIALLHRQKRTRCRQAGRVMGGLSHRARICVRLDAMHWTYSGCDFGRCGVRANCKQRRKPPRSLFAWPWHSVYRRCLRDRAFRGVSVPLPQLSSSHGASDGRRCSY